jgi:hypothetical protein
VKTCERCDRQAEPELRFCRFCVKAVLSELRKANYFTPIPRPRPRGDDARENVRETKYGIDF